MRVSIPDPAGPAGAAPARRLFLLREPDSAAQAAGSHRLAADVLAVSVEIETAPSASFNAEEIAHSCVRAIRAIQPLGPYLLAGCGDAGLIAVEAAYQLIGADQEVRFVGMLDTAPPCDDATGAAHTGRCRYTLPPLPTTLTLLADAGARGDALVRAWSGRVSGRTGLRTIRCSTADVVDRRDGAPLLQALDTQPGCIAEQARERRHAPILTIHAGKRGAAPVFIVPGAGASVTGLVHLAHSLGDTRPIYGLQPRGLCGELVPHCDVQHAAQCYVDALLTLLPSGPFHLAGHSYGGWVALEMARRMETLGRPALSLFVLDSRAPCDIGAHRAFHPPAQALEQLVDLYNLHLSQPMALRAADFAPLPEQSQLRLLLGELIKAKLFPALASIDMLRGIVRVFRSNLNTSYALAQPYSGPLHLVLADGSDDREELARNWRRHAPATRSFFSDGNHISLLSPPFVDTLGAYMRDVMQASETAGASFAGLPGR